MNRNKNLTIKLRRMADIRKEMSVLPADQALDRILASSEPAALVHSFPAQDLHLLVHDIGPESALPILKLASNRQWEYFLDVEGWHRDRMDLDAITHWAYLLLLADPTRMTRWVGNDKIEILEYYLFKNIEVVLREHDQDPSDFGDGFITLEGMFYIRILDHPVFDHPVDSLSEDDGAAKQAFGQMRRRLINDLLSHLADEDPVRFHQILLEAMHVIPAEVEEEAYRQRNIRMAENGFLPFDEAIGIYQSLTVQELKNRAASHREFRPSVGTRQPVMHFTTRLADGQDPVIQALEKIDSESKRLSALMELAGLANRLIVADQKLVRDRVDLKQAVQKACGYIRIGLAALAADMGDPSPDSKKCSKKDSKKSAAMLAHYSLPNVFQLGFGYALRIKWRADRWFRESWLQEQDLTLTFLGETWMGVLGGLLIKKPLFFDEALQAPRYREFTAMDDIVQTDAVLDRLMAMDSFLRQLGIGFEVQQTVDVFLTYKNLMLTLWVRDCLGLPRKVSPIETSLFRAFHVDTLFQSRISKQKAKSSNRDPANEVMTIRLSAKQSFLNWLISQSGFSETKIMAQIGPSLDALFSEIESELGRVAPENIDARFVTLFLLK